MAGRTMIARHDPVLGWTYIALAAAGVLGSVVSLGYYGSVMRALYAPRTDEPDDRTGQRGGGPATWTVALLAIFVVVLGLLPLFFGVARIVSPFQGR